MSNLRLGYNMRIYRPGIWYLNPYLNDSNPTNITQGNPNLDSEKSHAFNLSYSNFTQKFNVNLSLRYSFTNNSIEQISEMVPDTEIEGLKETTGKEVLYSTYQNIGKPRMRVLAVISTGMLHPIPVSMPISTVTIHIWKEPTALKTTVGIFCLRGCATNPAP